MCDWHKLIIRQERGSSTRLYRNIGGKIFFSNYNTDHTIKIFAKVDPMANSAYWRTLNCKETSSYCILCNISNITQHRIHVWLSAEAENTPTRQKLGCTKTRRMYHPEIKLPLKQFMKSFLMLKSYRIHAIDIKTCCPGNETRCPNCYYFFSNFWHFSSCPFLHKPFT